MDEKEIRSLPTETLVELKAKLQEQIGELDMSDKERIVKLEAAVSTLIARFKAAEEEEDKKKKEDEDKEMKAEEEALKVKAEEKKPQDEVPVTEIQAEEEGGDIAALEAKLAELQKMIEAKKFKANDGVVTPETPEDEFAMKVIKPPKIGNGNVAAKRGDIKIFETPAHKPGPLKAGKEFGKENSFNGAAQKKEVSAEVKAVKEIFEFAAKRGTTPMPVVSDLGIMLQ